MANITDAGDFFVCTVRAKCTALVSTAHDCGVRGSAIVKLAHPLIYTPCTTRCSYIMRASGLQRYLPFLIDCVVRRYVTVVTTVQRGVSECAHTPTSGGGSEQSVQASVRTPLRIPLSALPTIMFDDWCTSVTNTLLVIRI